MVRAIQLAVVHCSIFFSFLLPALCQWEPPASPPFTPSYYTSRLEDARAIYLTPENFPVKGDGIADDSQALQQAINTVQEKTNQGILFIPSGRYRITRTIYIWPGIRLIGFGAARPTFALAASTPGFQRGPA